MSIIHSPSQIKPNSPAGNSRPKIGLALSGAVMRGPVHVGVLRTLEAAGIVPDVVAGASAGALVGALYCAGLPVDALAEAAATTRWREIARPAFPPRCGFVSFSRLELWLQKYIGNPSFAELARPFAVSATDLERGAPIIFTAGKVIPAVHGSSAVPGFVVPVEHHGYILGDGGVSNNLPVAAARMLGADIVIAVDLFVPTIHRPLGPFRFGLAAIETMVRRSGGGIDSADVLISPPELAGESYIRTGAKQVARLIALGENVARAAIPEIMAKIAAY